MCVDAHLATRNVGVASGRAPEVRADQEHNAIYNEPLNAPRNADILRCRSEVWDESAHLGYLPRISDDDNPLHCVFLSEAILEKIKEFEWIDDMTEEVMVANLIYSPNADTVSMVKLDFQVESTGRVRPFQDVATNSVLNESSRWVTWQALMVTFIVVMSVRLVLVTRLLLRSVQKTTLQRADVALTIAFLAFSLYLLARRYTSGDTVTEGLLICVCPGGRFGRGPRGLPSRQ